MWLRSVIARLLGREVAKPEEIARADRVLADVDTLRVEVVTRREARLRGFDLQAETRTGKKR